VDLLASRGQQTTDGCGLARSGLDHDGIGGGGEGGVDGLDTLLDEIVIPAGVVDEETSQCAGMSVLQIR